MVKACPRPGPVRGAVFVPTFLPQGWVRARSRQSPWRICTLPAASFGCLRARRPTLPPPRPIVYGVGGLQVAVRLLEPLTAAATMPAVPKSSVVMLRLQALTTVALADVDVLVVLLPTGQGEPLMLPY